MPDDDVFVVDQFDFLNPPCFDRLQLLASEFKLGRTQVLQLALTLLSELHEAEQVDFERYVLSVSDLNLRIPAF